MNNDLVKNMRVYVYSEDDVVQSIMKAYNYPLEEAVKILTKGNYVFYPSVNNNYELGRTILFNIDTIIDTIGFRNIYDYMDRDKVYSEWETDLKQDWLEDYPDAYDFENDALYQEYVNQFLSSGIQQAIEDDDFEFIMEFFDYEKYGAEQYFKYADGNAILVY